MRARLAIAISKQTVELREILLKEKPEAMLQASPKGTVPVLVLEKGSVIDESLDIMTWTLEKNDPDTWLKPTDTKLIEENDSSFKQALDRYKYFNRYPEYPQEHYREQGESFLQKLETRLSESPFIFGEQMSLTDAAILPFVRQFAFVDRDWFDISSYKHTRRWLNTFLESSLFERIMMKHDPWQPGDEAILFP